MGHTSGFIQAHNGYIDAYLNVGIIGVSLIILAIVAGLLKAQRQLEREYAYAVLRIALILVAVAYNYTEAAFKPVNNVLVLLLIAILQCQRSRYRHARHQPEGNWPLSRAQKLMLASHVEPDVAESPPWTSRRASWFC